VPKGCPKWTPLSWAWRPENRQNLQAPPSATKSCQLSSNWLLFWLPRHPNDTKSGPHSFQKTAARTSLRAAPAQPQDNSYQIIGESCACTAVSSCQKIDESCACTASGKTAARKLMRGGPARLPATAARKLVRAVPAQPQANSGQKIGESCVCTASGNSCHTCSCLPKLLHDCQLHSPVMGPHANQYGHLVNAPL
jgi:hypothetical protein